MNYTVKGFGVINKAETGVFLVFSWFFYDPTDVGNLISGSSAFSKSSLNIWKSTVYVLLKPGLENFEHYFSNVGDACNCAVVWTFFEHTGLCLKTLFVTTQGGGVILQLVGRDQKCCQTSYNVQDSFPKQRIIQPKILRNSEKADKFCSRGCQKVLLNM